MTTYEAVRNIVQPITYCNKIAQYSTGKDAKAYPRARLLPLTVWVYFSFIFGGLLQSKRVKSVFSTHGGEPRKGDAEKARLENGAQKMQGWKIREEQVMCTFNVSLDNVNGVKCRPKCNFYFQK